MAGHCVETAPGLRLRVSLSRRSWRRRITCRDLEFVRARFGPHGMDPMWFSLTSGSLDLVLRTLYFVLCTSYFVLRTLYFVLSTLICQGRLSKRKAQSTKHKIQSAKHKAQSTVQSTKHKIQSKNLPVQKKHPLNEYPSYKSDNFMVQ